MGCWKGAEDIENGETWKEKTSPSLKKAEIQEEWKERAVSQVSKDPYSHSLALQTLRGSAVGV